MHVGERAVHALAVQVARHAVGAHGGRDLALRHGRELVNAGTHSARRLAVAEQEGVQQRGRLGHGLDDELELAVADEADRHVVRHELAARRRDADGLADVVPLVLLVHARVQRVAPHGGRLRVVAELAERRARAVRHRPLREGVRLVQEGHARERLVVEEVGELAVHVRRRRVHHRVHHRRAVLHAEHARRVEHEGVGGGRARGAVQLERHHVGALRRAVVREDHVEHVEAHVVVLAARRGVEGRGEEEARHQTPVEVGDAAAGELRAHVQHAVVVERGDREGLAQVDGRLLRRAELRGVHLRPALGEVGGVPARGGRALLEHAPLVELHLEGEERGEDGGDGGGLGHLRQLSHVHGEAALVHGEAVARARGPAVAHGVEALEGVDAVGVAHVHVEETARHGDEGRLLLDDALRAAPLVDGVAVLVGEGVRHPCHRHQALAARALVHGDGDGRLRRRRVQVLGVDRVGGGGLERARNAADHARVGVDHERGGELRRGGEVVVERGGGVHLRHLDVAVHRHGLVGQRGDRRGHLLERQVQRLQLPVGLVRPARAEVGPAEHRVGLGRLDPQLAVLARRGPRQPGHVRQRRPLRVLGVLGDEDELPGGRAQLEVVRLHVQRVDPLAAVAVQLQLDPVVAREAGEVLAEEAREGLAVGAADPVLRHRVLVHARGLGGDEPREAVEGGGRVASHRHDRHRDGVGALAEELHAVGGHGDGDLAERRGAVALRGQRGGGQLARHALAEHLVVVDDDDAARLVLDGEHEAREILQGRHGEGLLVELDLVRGGGERAGRRLAPARDGAAGPGGGDLAHLVVPRGARLDGGRHAENGGGGEREVGVVADEGDGVEAVHGDVRLHQQEGALLPELLRALRHHGDEGAGRAERVEHVRLVLLRGRVVHDEQVVPRGLVLHRELLVGRVGRVGALHAQHRARALRDGQRDGARNAAVHRRGDHVARGGTGGLRLARDAAGGGQRETRRQRGRDGAVGELQTRGLDGDGLVDGEELIRGHGVLDGRGDGAVAHEELHLVDARLRRLRVRDREAVELVHLGVAHGGVVLGRLVGELPAGRLEHGLEALGGLVGALEHEGVGSRRYGGRGEEAHAVHRVRAERREVEEDREGSDVGDVGRPALVEVDHLVRVGAGGGRDHGDVGNDVALAALEGAGVQGEERFKRGRFSALEGVELHSQHRLGVLGSGGGADHSVVAQGVVRACRHRRRSRRAGGHVVAEDLESVDVGNHTELVLNAHFHRSHVVQSHEGLAEVHGSGERELRRRHVLGPRSVLEGEVRPPTRRRGRLLPRVRLLHGRVQRQRDFFRFHLGHERLDDDVPVLAFDRHVGSVRPGVAHAVLHDKRVLVVVRAGQAHVQRLFLVVFKCRTRVKDGVSSGNLKTLLSRVSRALLDDLCVHFAISTR